MKPSKMLAVGHFSLNQVAFLVGPRKKGHVQAMFCCAAWRKMPRCGLPGGFGEDDPSKTVEIMIRSYQISDHMTYIYTDIRLYILSHGCSQFPLIKKGSPVRCLNWGRAGWHFGHGRAGYVFYQAKSGGGFDNV
jgi:hypothetical protein